MVQPTEYKTKFKVSTEVQGDGKLKGFTASLKEITNQGAQSAKSLKEIAVAAGGLSGSLDSIRRSSLTSTKAIQNDIRKLRDELRDVGREAKNTSQAFVGIGGGGGFAGIGLSLGSVQGKALAAAAAIHQIVGALRAVAEVRARVDQVNATLDIVNRGDLTQTNSDMEFLRSTVDRLGLSFSQTSDLFVKINAAAAQTSLTTATTRDIFEAFAGTVGRLNLSADSSNRIFFALQQIISKSVVSSEELKNQLGEKIPGVLAISARAIGVNVDQLQKMLENGEVLADDFLPKLAAELKKTFGVDATTNIDTAAASLARFDNAIDNVQRRFAEGPIGDAIVSVFEYATNSINEAGEKLKLFNSLVDDMRKGEGSKGLLNFLGTEAKGLLLGPLLRSGDASTASGLRKQILELEQDAGKTRPGMGDTSGKNSLRDLERKRQLLREIEAEDERRTTRDEGADANERARDMAWKALREEMNADAAKAAKEEAKRAEEKAKIDKDAFKRLSSQRATANAQLDEYLDQLTMEINKGEDLTKVDKIRVDLLRVYNGNLPQAIVGRLKMAEAAEVELRTNELAAEETKKHLAQIEKESEAFEEKIKSINEQTAELELQNRAYDDSKVAIEQVIIADLERQAAASATSESVRQNIQREIAARRGLVEQLKEADAKEAAKKLSDDFDKAADDVKKALTDAIVNGTDSAGQYIKNYFKSLSIRLLIDPVLDAGSAVIKQILLGGQGGAGGLLQSLFGSNSGSGIGSGVADAAKKFFSDPAAAFSNIKSFTDLTSILKTGVAGIETAIYNGFEGGLNAVGVTGNANIALSNAGVIGSSAAIAYGGYRLGRGISGGFSLNGGTGNSTVNIGAIAGGILGAAGGPIGIALGSAIGSIIGGSINRLFGRKRVLQGAGLEGTFGAGGFIGTGFQDVQLKGGLFRSDKNFTEYSQLGGDVTASIGEYMVGLNQSIISTAKLLRSDAETAIQNFATSGKFYGSLQSILQNVGDQLIRLVVPNIAEFRLETETLADTLARVVQAVSNANQASILLGGGVSFTAKNVAAAFNLMEVGGENLLAQIEQYVNAFVPAGKRAARQLEVFNEAVQASGLSGVISADSTREQFAKLVEGLDLTSEAGQRQLQVLLSLTPQLDQIITLREQERAALQNARVQTQAYIDLLTGNVLSSLQTIAAQIVDVSTKLNFTTDSQAKLALESQLGDLIFQRYQAELEMLGQVQVSINGVFDSIKSERDALAANRASIGGGSLGTMTAAQIRQGVAGASLLGTLPASGGIQVAAERSAQLNAEIESQSALLASLSGLQSTRNDQLQNELSISAKAVALFNANRRVGSAFATGAAGGLASAGFDSASGMNRLDYQAITYNVGDDASVVALRNSLVSVFVDALEGQSILGALESANSKVNTARSELLKVNAQIASAQVAVEQLKTALIDAETQKVAAQEAYIQQIQSFVVDAGQAVSKLSRLREETVRFYEQQATLANLMQGQADSLRTTVNNIRFADLNPLQQLGQLQQQFGVAFASASVSSGEALAGFGGQVNSLIGPILEKAAEVYASGPEFQRIKALIIGQAETVAGKLETLSPQNYQQESLAILDTIDTTLDLIESNTKSAETLIVSAIDRSRDATLQGLRGVIAAITGESIPAFRSGGSHMGGPRIVGESGPELEVSGPSRIYSNRQLGNMLMGAPGQSEVVAELQELRKEVRAGGDLQLKVVTPDGRIVMEKTLRELKERSRKGELVVYTDGVK